MSTTQLPHLEAEPNEEMKNSIIHRGKEQIQHILKLISDVQLEFSCRRSLGSKGEGVSCVGVHVTHATWVCNVLHGAGSANLYGIEVRSCTRRYGSSARLHGARSHVTVCQVVWLASQVVGPLGRTRCRSCNEGTYNQYISHILRALYSSSSINIHTVKSLLSLSSHSNEGTEDTINMFT